MIHVGSVSVTVTFLFVLHPQMDSIEAMEEDWTRWGPTLQSYAQLTSRPCVSFAQDSPDTPLPARTFLSHMEFSEEGQLRMVRGSEPEWNQLGNNNMNKGSVGSSVSDLIPSGRSATCSASGANDAQRDVDTQAQRVWRFWKYVDRT